MTTKTRPVIDEAKLMMLLASNKEHPLLNKPINEVPTLLQWRMKIWETAEHSELVRSQSEDENADSHVIQTKYVDSAGIVEMVESNANSPGAFSKKIINRLRMTGDEHHDIPDGEGDSMKADTLQILEAIENMIVFRPAIDVGDDSFMSPMLLVENNEGEYLYNRGNPPGYIKHLKTLDVDVSISDKLIDNEGVKLYDHELIFPKITDEDRASPEYEVVDRILWCMAGGKELGNQHLIDDFLAEMSWKMHHIYEQTAYQRLFLGLSQGDGKSALLYALRMVFWKKHCEQLKEVGGKWSKTEYAKPIAIMPELRKDKQDAGERIKAVAGDLDVERERKYKDQKTSRCITTLFMCSNGGDVGTEENPYIGEEARRTKVMGFAKDETLIDFINDNGLFADTSKLKQSVVKQLVKRIGEHYDPKRKRGKSSPEGAQAGSVDWAWERVTTKASKGSRSVAYGTSFKSAFYTQFIVSKIDDFITRHADKFNAADVKMWTSLAYDSDDSQPTKYVVSVSKTVESAILSHLIQKDWIGNGVVERIDGVSGDYHTITDKTKFKEHIIDKAKQASDDVIIDAKAIDTKETNNDS